MGNLLRHGVHDGLRGHDGACNCSFGVDGLAGRIRTSDQAELISQILQTLPEADRAMIVEVVQKIATRLKDRL